MESLMINLIWAVVVLIVVVMAIVTIFLSPFTDVLKRYADMKEKISSNEKEVQKYKLSIIEKNPQMFKDLV